ncbi:hypothetical protein KO527_14390 [Pseudoalteromonas sp. C2R02]|uniref:hypothetical protein n=1 Tax=Pseudoalteromonas sp. C2R02 TaxID=2841565 RepID=UPI001C09F235|nr:hypothetical protein [Pseudoalteromonas sp. C2R02]MBU2970540.1 hypothetical protein [Pseudoalteromonas sp. C2R02]
MSNRSEPCDFGPYKGILYSKLPISYIHWMINSKHKRSEWAIIELNKREQAVKDSNKLV